MNLLHVLQAFFPHKYAINAKLLGDSRENAWSNLGFWDDQTKNYIQASQQLATVLAQSVQLNEKDRLIDLGCGQGASLLLWKNQFHVKAVTAIELQKKLVKKLHQQGHLSIYQASFLQSQNILPAHSFDVVLCVDAAYHTNLNDFLAAAHYLLAENGRVGFHYLLLSDAFFELSVKQKKAYQYLLKMADVDLNQLMNQQNLQQQFEKQGFQDLQLIDLSEQVFGGFSRYIDQKLKMKISSLDTFKIKMTAKLCQKLNQDGLIRYVQLSAKTIKAH